MTQDTRTSSISSTERKDDQYDDKKEGGFMKVDANQLKKNLQELFDEAQDKIKNTEQEARRKRTHTHMLAQ